ncbi:hypothetical protein ES332_A09G183900v1 [Gossypium tomentosum]|uniref:Dol-P-Glc:Glc(2)Man(9)GlcNAc(2)-PP-Dol alpha-1,2-glucosyltransferase n=1 Tax=Gossypium tomentosum TaxID=34277 RepID=A0A5D2P3Y1_GOSTO|nr:hypothetical protein ES332_A09G183900v1 [Gossypium tomentosum]
MGRIATAAIVSLWVIPVSVLVNRIVPDPYMDEIFHIPQAQKYCNGDFMSWDPMITTPPGLYYLSLVHVAALLPSKYVLQLAPSFPEACSTAVLRSVNGVLAVLCSIIVYEIITHLRPALDDRKLGAMAVVIRQTNIIWMLFVACSGVIDITMAHQKDSVEVDDSKASNKGTNLSALNTSVNVSSNLKRRKSRGNSKANQHIFYPSNTSSASQTLGLLHEIQAIVLSSWRIKWELLVSFSPFFFVLLAFVAFLLWNGSVVLGAKEAHAVSPHFAQIMYFSILFPLFLRLLCISQ